MGVSYKKKYRKMANFTETVILTSLILNHCIHLNVVIIFSLNKNTQYTNNNNNKYNYIDYIIVWNTFSASPGEVPIEKEVQVK